MCGIMPKKGVAMGKTDFIHISDLHIGYTPNGELLYGEVCPDDNITSLKKLLDYINNNNIRLLLISGDLFHNVPTYKDLQHIDDIFAEIPNTAIIYCTGENDYMDKECALSNYTFKSNVYVIGADIFRNPIQPDSELYGERTDMATAMVDILEFGKLGVRIYGAGVFSRNTGIHVLEDIVVDNDDMANVLISYGGMGGGIPITFNDLKKSGFDYIALGHDHSYKNIFNTNIYYAGSLEPLDCQETGRHGFIRGLISQNDKSEKKYVVKTSFVPSSCKEYKTINYPVSRYMTNEDTAKDIVRYIEQEGAANIYSINLARTDNCENRFDITRYLSSYNILAVTGEVFERNNYDEYIKANRSNMFSRLLDEMNGETPLKSDAGKLAVDTMIEVTGINYRHSRKLSDKLFEDNKDKVISLFVERKAELSSSDILHEYEEARQKLEVNPDILDKLNATWAEERKAELELRTATNYINQIKPGYKHKWMKSGIRAAVVPFIIFCLILIMVMPYSYMRIAQGKVDMNYVIYLISGLIVTVVCFLLGYGLSVMRDYKKNSDRGIKHDIMEARKHITACEEKVSKLRNHRRELQLMENRRKAILDDINSKERKAENIYYEIQLLEEAVRIFDR
jgi:DNA repair exonuclease SbcCD nuclease subunit